uniref:Tudor domain-containing protein n=1 Tax=Timema douglasi TaxID=61478 RepID=A0A7R8VB41_TIMDO|nr:unnamed protein product [Timema douglasi]
MIKASVELVERLISKFSPEFDKVFAIPHESSLSIGQVCCARYQDGVYYRARITSLSDLMKAQVSVLFIDYGNSEVVFVDDIRVLDSVVVKPLNSLPGQATEFYLAGVIPAIGDWNDESLQIIRQTICYAELQGVILSQCGNKKLLNLLYQNQDFSRILIDSNIAAPIALQAQQAIIQALFTTPSFPSFNVPPPALSSTNRSFPSIRITGQNAFPELRCKLYYVDFGNSEILPYSEIYNIPDEFVVPKVMALRFTLFALKDLGKITNDVKTMFNDIVSEKLVQLRVTPADGPPLKQYCELYTNGQNYEGNTDALNKVMTTLETHCETASILQPKLFRVGMPCCALYSEDNQWYRAQILSITPHSVNVHYIDYGNTDSIQYSMLKEISPSLVEILGAQAVRCCLKGFQSNHRDELTGMFEEMTLGKSLKMVVTGTGYMESETLVVELYDESISPPVNIGSKLLIPDTIPTAQENGNFQEAHPNIDAWKENESAEPLESNVQSNLFERKKSWENKEKPDQSGFRSSEVKVVIEDEVDNSVNCKVSDNDSSSEDESSSSSKDRLLIKIKNLGERNEMMIQENPGRRKVTAIGERGEERRNGVAVGIGQMTGEAEKLMRNTVKVGTSLALEEVVMIGEVENPGKKGNVLVKKIMHKVVKKIGVETNMVLEATEKSTEEESHGKKENVSVKMIIIPEIIKTSMRIQRMEDATRINGRIKMTMRKVGNREIMDLTLVELAVGDLSKKMIKMMEIQMKGSLGTIVGNFENTQSLQTSVESGDTWDDEPKSVTVVSLVTDLPSAVIKVGDTKTVEIVYAVSPENFYVQNTSMVSVAAQISIRFAFSSPFRSPVTPDNAKLIEMMDRMALEYGEGTKTALPLIKPGAICVARYSVDEMWYRGVVKSVGDTTALVSFPDYGNMEDVPLTDIMGITHEFSQLPVQGIKCALLASRASSSEWSEDEVNNFVSLTELGEIEAHFVCLREECFKVVLKNKQTGEVINEKFGASSQTIETAIQDAKPTVKQFVPQVSSFRESTAEYVDEGERFLEPQVPLSETIDVIITWFISPEEFYCQSLKKSQEIKSMMTEIQSVYCRSPRRKKNLDLGSPVIAKFRSDNVFYRAEISEKIGESFIVKFVDFGNKDIFTKFELWDIEKQFMVLPKQAIHSFLKDIKPAQLSWPVGVSEIDSYFNSEKFNCIFHTNVDGRFCATLSQNGKNVGDELVSKGLASMSPPQDLFVYGLAKFFVQVDAPLINFIQVMVDEHVQNQNNVAPLPDDQLVLNALCISSPDSEQWYRAMVLDCTNTAGVLVNYLDYGDTDEVSKDKLLEIPASLASFPGQALECSLTGIDLNPPNSDLEEQFKEFLEDQDVIMHVDSITENRLNVTLYDTDGKKFELINHLGNETFQVDPLCPQLIRGQAQVWVSHAEGTKLYLQTVKDADVLAVLLEQLFSFYETESQGTALDANMGQLCAAKSSKDDGWYRAKVLSVSKDDACVVFLDYGNSETIPLSNLRVLDVSFHVPNIMSFCVILPVEPTVSIEEFTEKVNNLTFEKEFVASFILSEGKWLAELVHNDCSLSAQLVSMNFATRITGTQFATEQVISDELLAQETKLSVFLSHIESPALFWVQNAGDAAAIEGMQFELQTKADDLQIIETLPDEDTLLAALYDESWYRAKVLETDNNLITVVFVDYGNTDVIDITSGGLRTLPDELKQSPGFAIKCKFSLEPLEGSEWSAESMERFESLLESEDPLTVEILSGEEVKMVNMFSSDKNIADILVVEGFALLTSEVQDIEQQSKDINKLEIKDSERHSQDINEVEVKDSEQHSQDTNEVEVKNSEQHSQDVNEVEVKDSEHHSQDTNEIEATDSEQHSQDTNEVEVKNSEQHSQDVNGVEVKNSEHNSQDTNEIEAEDSDHHSQDTNEVEVKDSECDSQNIIEVEVEDSEQHSQDSIKVEVNIEHNPQDINKVGVNNSEQHSQDTTEVEVKDSECDSQNITEVEVKNSEQHLQDINEVKIEDSEQLLQDNKRLEVKANEHHSQDINEVKVEGSEQLSQEIVGVEDNEQHSQYGDCIESLNSSLQTIQNDIHDKPLIDHNKENYFPGESLINKPAAEACLQLQNPGGVESQKQDFPLDQEDIDGATVSAVDTTKNATVVLSNEYTLHITEKQSKINGIDESLEGTNSLLNNTLEMTKATVTHKTEHTEKIIKQISVEMKKPNSLPCSPIVSRSDKIVPGSISRGISQEEIMAAQVCNLSLTPKLSHSEKIVPGSISRGDSKESIYATQEDLSISLPTTPRRLHTDAPKEESIHYNTPKLDHADRIVPGSISRGTSEEYLSEVMRSPKKPHSEKIVRGSVVTDESNKESVAEESPQADDSNGNSYQPCENEPDQMIGQSTKGEGTTSS